MSGRPRRCVAGARCAIEEACIADGCCPICGAGGRIEIVAGAAHPVMLVTFEHADFCPVMRDDSESAA